MNKMKRILFYTAVSFSSATFCQKPLLDSQNNDITTFIENTMEEIEIPGVAVAVIKDNEVVYKNYLGKANLEYDIPVTASSLFRLHSLSKVFVAVGVFQLIEQKQMALEDKISMYLTDLPDEWKDIKIKHLLAHASGLPDMRDETDPSEEIAQKNVYARDIQFPLGERANYNQTNFWLLNRIIRVRTRASFQSYITTQFNEGSNVCFSNISDIVPDRVMEYKPNSTGQLKNSHFIVQDYMYGAGGITMSLDDLIDWDQKLTNNVLLTKESKEKMFNAFQYKVGKGFSHGWDIQYLNGIISYGFNGGGLVNYRRFPSKNISVIWFTNGYRKPHNIDNITNRIVGFLDKDLMDKTPEFANLLKEIVESNKPKKVRKKYDELKGKYPFVNFERVINGLGYQLLGEKRMDKAIILFELNTEEFPESANAFDSLAEGYYLNDQFELSKENYKKSLELDPSNTNASKMIKKIETEN